MRTEQANYLPPMVEVIEMENEGVIAASAGTLNKQQWPSSTKSSGAYRSGRASSSDLEDMINDILTIEK